jgi:hypothetical protein
LAAVANDVEGLNSRKSPSPGFIVITNVIPVLCGNLAQVLLFMSLMSMLLNRHNSLRDVSDGQSGKTHIAAYIALAMFVFLLLVLTIVEAILDGILVNADVNDLDPAIQESDYNNHQNLYITYNSFQIASVFFVTSYTVVLYKALTRAGTSDKVRSLLHY